MISENKYLIPSWIKKGTFNMKDLYLLVVTDLENDITSQKDPLDEKLESIKKML